MDHSISLEGKVFASIVLAKIVVVICSVDDGSRIKQGFVLWSIFLKIVCWCKQMRTNAILNIKIFARQYQEFCLRVLPNSDELLYYFCYACQKQK
jgi:hypothetical protein